MNRLFLFLFASMVWAAQDPTQIVEEAQNKSRAASQHYEGTLQVTDAKGKVLSKRWMYDRLGSHGQSKVVLRFTEPAEVRGVALLIVNHPERASDQWMYTPEIGRERRIAFQDRSTRFFGTDFTFEDLEERDVKQFDYKMLGEDSIEGALCWKIESRPKSSKSSQYTHSYLWIRKDNYAFARIESFKGEAVIRQLQYGSLRNVQGIWTPHKLDMYDVRRKSRTVLVMDKLQYNVPLKEEDFTLQAIRRTL
jgi:hypothetical protein